MPTNLHLKFQDSTRDIISFLFFKDLFSSVKQRNTIKFVDIVNGGEQSDLTLDQLQGYKNNYMPEFLCYN